MKKKTKRLLFFLSVLFFLLLSWVTVLFAFGYKYDFVLNKFFKTGSLELSTNESVEVYINDELAGSTSFLGDSFSKGRFLPRTYSIRLQNEKYQSWQKLVKIEAGFITGFPRVILLPKDFKEDTLASSSFNNVTTRRFIPEDDLAVLGNKQKLESINLKNGAVKPFKTPTVSPALGKPQIQPAVFVSPDNGKTAWFNDHEIWIKWMKDSDYQPFKRTGDVQLVTRFSQKIDDIQWYKDSEHLFISVGGIIKFIEIDTRGGLNLFEVTTVSGPFYYDRDQDALFKFEGNRLVRIDLLK